MSSKIIDIEDLLPPKPQAPNPRDCCGSGCCPCVHDIYEEDLRKWKKKCKRIKQGDLEELQSEGVIQPNEWREFEVVEIDEISQDCFRYTFRLPEGQSLGLRVGQHVIVQQMKNNRPVIRQYTPISDVSETGSFVVLIKIYPSGRITQLIKDWKVGDLIPWRGPFGSYSYRPNSYKRILILAAGTGIAPLYQVIKAIIDNDEDETVVKLWYASKTFADILLREELLECCRYWNFTMNHFLSQESNIEKKKYNENVFTRRLNKGEVSEELVKYREDGTTLVLICGTKSFDKDNVNAAKDAGMPDANIFKF